MFPNFPTSSVLTCLEASKIKRFKEISVSLLHLLDQIFNSKLSKKLYFVLSFKLGIVINENNHITLNSRPYCMCPSIISTASHNYMIPKHDQETLENYYFL